MNNLPVEGYPLNAIFYLEDLLSKELNRKDIKYFYLDISNDLKQVIEKLKCNYIEKLFTNVNKECLEQVNQGLLKSFQFHPKFKNINIEISNRGVRKPSFVYIAIWQHI